ncbi:MAG: prolipoprotein diacylglyceryl transferase [Treponema sp.]|nr:prolipoprotein diacylglyceryl transferase [Treponema sp.]
MFPFLDLKIIKIPMYGLCMAIGIYAAALVAAFILIKNKEKFLNFLLIAVIALAFGVAGAKILYILTAFPIKDFFLVIGRMLFTKGNPGLSSGFVFFGGLILGPIGYLLGCKIASCKTGSFLNEFAVVIPLAHTFGRIGCFCGGCCYGILYNGPGRLIYKEPLSSVPRGIGIFPVQLLEAFLLFLLFFTLFLIFMNRKKKNLNEEESAASGQKKSFSSKRQLPLFAIYILSYSIIRFCLEFLRGDVERGHLAIFSTSQWVSLTGFLLALVWIFLSMRKSSR